MSDEVEQRKELQEKQHDLAVDEAMTRMAGQMAAEKSQHTVQNPEFLRQLQDPDADTAVWDWVEAEVGPSLSGAHILGNRGDHYEEQQELLNRNLVERLIAEGSRGRLLQQNPRLDALAQGVAGTQEYPDPTENPQYREALTSAERRVLRQVHEIITNRQSLSINSEGLSAVADATVENKSIQSEEEQQRGVGNRLRSVYK